MILIAGGLAGLGLLPDASVVLTLPPQALVGAGLALTALGADRGGARRALAAGDPRRLDDRRPPRRGGRRPAGAHAGVHRRPRDRARRRRAGRDRARCWTPQRRPGVEARPGDADRRPDRRPRATRSRWSARRSTRCPTDPAERAADDRAARPDRGRGRQRRHARVQRLVPDRGGVRARGVGPDRPRAPAEWSCERPRAGRARPLRRGRARCRRLPRRGRRLATSRRRSPTRARPREWTSPEGAEEIAQQFFLSALDGAACELGVSRETLAAALATEESRQAFAAEQGIDDAELETAVRAGVVRAIDDAEDAGAISAVRRVRPARACRRGSRSTRRSG